MMPTIASMKPTAASKTQSVWVRLKRWDDTFDDMNGPTCSIWGWVEIMGGSTAYEPFLWFRSGADAAVFVGCGP